MSADGASELNRLQNDKMQSAILCADSNFKCGIEQW